MELGLRYVWVMSDNFQFSAMHRNWSRLYWNPLNDVGEGYRDYPPAPNDERTHTDTHTDVHDGRRWNG